MGQKAPDCIVNRWSIPFAGFLLSLMGGFSYAWGVFVIPMGEAYGWSKAEASLPFTVMMVVFSLCMIPGGRLQDVWGPRKTAALGSLLFFVSYGLAALVGHFPFVWWLVVSYGVLGGIACGLTYACVAPPARKWFPDRPGVAISFSVMGFGLASLVLAPIKAHFFIPVWGIAQTFAVCALITSSISLFAAWLMRNPPAGWLPPEGVIRKRVFKTIGILRESPPLEMLKHPVFWCLWLIFAFVSSGGLICIGMIPSYGEQELNLSPVGAAVGMSIFAGFNGFGRPLAGMLADRFGAVSVMIATFAIQCAAFLLFPVLAVTPFALYAAAAVFGWGYAVILALFPILTASSFGTRNLGVNYGIVFTAFGVAALAPTLGSWLHDKTDDFSPAFYVAGSMTLIGLILTMLLKRKSRLD